MLHPFGSLAVECLGKSNVRHTHVLAGAMPMLGMGRDPDNITRPNLLNRTFPMLYEADTCGDDQRLAQRVGMPSRARARLEGNDPSTKAGRLFETWSRRALSP